MERNVNYFWVGIFVSLSLIAMVGFIIWLVGASDTRNYTKYTIYFNDPVSGLTEGGQVQYKGVPVGTIKKIRLTPNQIDLIKVDIEIAQNTPVRLKTKATLAMQGITGRNYIELTTEADDTQPPRRMTGEKYPVIEGSGTQLSKLFADVPKITDKILSVSTKLDEILNEQNTKALSNTVANLEHLSKDLNGLLTDENVQNFSAAVANISTASEEFKGMVLKFEQTADKIDEAVVNINEAAIAGKEGITKASRDGVNKLIELSVESRKAAESVRRLSDKLNDDPSQLIYKQKPQGVEIPK